MLVVLDIYLFVLVEKASDWPLTKDYREIHWPSQGILLWALGEVCPVGLSFSSINPTYLLLWPTQAYSHVRGATRNTHPRRQKKKKQRTLFFWNWWVPLSVHQFWTWHSWEAEQWLCLSAAALPLDNPEGKFSSLTAGAGPSLRESSERILGTTGTSPHVFHNET